MCSSDLPSQKISPVPKLGALPLCMAPGLRPKDPEALDGSELERDWSRSYASTAVPADDPTEGDMRTCARDSDRAVRAGCGGGVPLAFAVRMPLSPTLFPLPKIVKFPPALTFPILLIPLRARSPKPSLTLVLLLSMTIGLLILLFRARFPPPPAPTLRLARQLPSLPNRSRIAPKKAAFDMVRPSDFDVIVCPSLLISSTRRPSNATHGGARYTLSQSSDF